MQILKKELRSCQHFVRDFDFERVKHNVFNCAVENVNESLVNEKLDHFFFNSKDAAE